MAFLLSPEQLKELGKHKINPKVLSPESPPIIRMGVNKNNKPYLVLGKTTFYIHQAKSIVAMLKDPRYKLEELERFVDLMAKYKDKANEI